MEDSRFAEASRRVYLSLIVLRVRVAGVRIGRMDGSPKVATSGSEFHQMDTGTFLVIKKHAFLWVTCWVQTFLERLANAELLHFDHLQMKLFGSI